jgi:glycosyltransferase involved in cell wall biosynthesis
MKINFISNQDLGTISGGWSGINYNMLDQLSKHIYVNYVGPINPGVGILSKIESKIFRTVGLKGKFFFFSNKRLDIIEKEVKEAIINTDVKYNFFFGQTAWLHCDFDLPYGVYLDAGFITYLKIFSDFDKFNAKDLDRIAKKEESWLQKAQHIFVGSQWAWDEMTKYYNLDENQKIVVHTGGTIDYPSEDTYKDELNFLFISLNFEKKGGFLCVDAFKAIKKEFPSAELNIVGERPPEGVLKEEGVTYVGLLKKTVSEDLEKFKQLLSEAFLLIHPTTMDTMGAVLIEAGYFGCPSIAPKSFGIPELIIENKTGLLLDIPFSSEDIVNKIKTLINDKNQYQKMRVSVKDDMVSRLSWESIGNKMSKKIIDGDFNN